MVFSYYRKRPLHLILAALLTFQSCSTTEDSAVNDGLEEAVPEESVQVEETTAIAVDEESEEAQSVATTEVSESKPEEQTPVPETMESYSEVAQAPAPQQPEVEAVPQMELPPPREESIATPVAADPVLSDSSKWYEKPWIAKRFLDRTQVTKDDILSGRVVFLKPGQGYADSFHEIKQSNKHLRRARKLVSGDHFDHPTGWESATYQEAQYTVRKGDTLQKISEKVYGTKDRWLEIYFMNNQISHFDRIEVGMNLSYSQQSDVMAHNEIIPSMNDTGHAEANLNNQISNNQTSPVPPIQENIPPPPTEPTPVQNIQTPPAEHSAVPQPSETIVSTPPAQAPPMPLPQTTLPIRQKKTFLNSNSKVQWVRIGVLLALAAVFAWGGAVWLNQRKRKIAERKQSLSGQFTTYSEMMRNRTKTMEVNKAVADPEATVVSEKPAENAESESKEKIS